VFLFGGIPTKLIRACFSVRCFDALVFPFSGEVHSSLFYSFSQVALWPQENKRVALSDRVHKITHTIIRGWMNHPGVDAKLRSNYSNYDAWGHENSHKSTLRENVETGNSSELRYPVIIESLPSSIRRNEAEHTTLTDRRRFRPVPV
jgi:hypothetical protein